MHQKKYLTKAEADHIIQNNCHSDADLNKLQLFSLTI